jgi:hypothetical protein
VGRHAARGALDATWAGRASPVPRFRRAVAACVRAACHGWATAVLPEADAPARAAVPSVLHLASAYQPRGQRPVSGASSGSPSRPGTGALNETCGAMPQGDTTREGEEGLPPKRRPSLVTSAPEIFSPQGTHQSESRPGAPPLSLGLLPTRLESRCGQSLIALNAKAAPVKGPLTLGCVVRLAAVQRFAHRFSRGAASSRCTTRAGSSR